MSPKVQITKDMILNAAFKVLQEKGADSLSARSIAKAIGCSTQPIYSVFSDIDKLQYELLLKCKSFSESWLAQPIHCEDPFLSIGLRYIDLAIEEKEVFSFLYTSNKLPFRKFLNSPKGDKETKNLLMAMAQDSHLKELDEEECIKLLRDMWIFTHGLASLVGFNALKYSRSEIREQLKTTGKKMIIASLHMKSEKGGIK